MTEHHGAESTAVSEGSPAFRTGGWDSTFRVLELLFRYGCKVQPIYVIDTRRRSLQLELDSIERVRTEIDKNHPQLSPLLSETIFLNREDMESATLTSQRYFSYYSQPNENTIRAHSIRISPR